MKKLLLMISIFFLLINKVSASDIVSFSKCIDGDTFNVILDDKEYTVRMLAIDTPESVHPTKGVEYYGKEASDYTCNKITNAKKIELVYEDNSDKLDKYERLLAWVFVDDKLLQEELVENGYAKVAYLYGDYKYTSLLQEHQELASIKNLGIWNDEAKRLYNSQSNQDGKEYTTIDIVIIVILILVIIFASNKTIKKKAKKQLKKYLK